jgi:hypothetical protein
MICSKCGIEHNNKHRYCSNCHAKYQRDYRKLNISKFRNYDRERYAKRRLLKPPKGRTKISPEEKIIRSRIAGIKYYHNHIEKIKEYKIKNQEHYRQYGKEWSKKNIHKKNASSSKRKVKMTVCDLNKSQKNEIYEIYRKAQLKTQKTGIIYHVDHIVPLSMNGQHVPSNLRIITANENLKKGRNIPIGTQIPLMI